MDDELVGVLRREQRLLELLLFRLVALRNLLASGDPRFLVRASAEVRIALDRVRETEMLRAALTERISRSCGLEGVSCTLRAVAEWSPSPYGIIVEDLRTGLDVAFREAVEVAASVRGLAAAGLTGLQRRPDPQVTDHDARLDAVKARQGYEAAHAATDGVTLASLAESLC